MVNDPYTQYRRTQTEGADQGELLLMLYRGAIGFLQRARPALRNRDFPTSHACIVRAEDILEELGATLNPQAGDVAVNLARIYEYAYMRLVEANTRKDPAGVEEVIGILQQLLVAWQDAVRQTRAGRQQASGRPVQAAALAGVGAR